MTASASTSVEWTATGIADEVRAGRRTAVDTVTESLARIRSYNDDVDAFQVVRSESMNRSEAPVYTTAFAGAAYVSVDTQTSSPDRTPATTSARCNAAVPLANATAASAPVNATTSASKPSTAAPMVVIQLESKACNSRSRSLPDMSGGDR